jgi:flagellar M-ring protein FliF
VDETGRLLADGAAEENAATGSTADERKVAYEKRMRDQVESIVTSVVGPGRARVQLTADFDFNRITQTSDRFDPEGRVVRSSQTREETSAADRQEGAVSVGNELPGANQQQAGAQNQPNQNRKTEEIVNYDISRTTKTEVIEGGRVNRVSVAVVVDGTYTRNDKGEMVYAPRSKEDIDRIAALVRTAIGFDQKRGDQVEVANLRLAETPSAPAAEPAGWMSMFQFTKDDMMRAIELGVMALLALIVLFIGVRPMLRKALGTDKKAALAAAAAAGGATVVGPGGVTITMAGGAGAIQGPGNGVLTTAGGPNVAIVGSDQDVAISNRTSAMIDIAKVQGQVHAESVKKVGELAEKNPNEAVAVIRSWLHENAA